MLLAPRLDTAMENITDLLKFDLVFSRRVVLMSLFLLAAWIYRRSFCVLTGTATENSFSSLNHMKCTIMVWITPE